MVALRHIVAPLGCVLLAFGSSSVRQSTPIARWTTHGGNAAHTGRSYTKSQDLLALKWSTPLDLNPQYSGTILYAHYGSPVITANNTVIVPVKTGATDGFKVEARNGANGALMWTSDTSYTVPPHNWFPTFGPTLYGATGVAWPRGGGLVAMKADADVAGSAVKNVCFYGTSAYNADKNAYLNNVKITSPLVGTNDGTIYFTYRVLGDTPNKLKSGIVMIKPDGTCKYISCASATGDANYTRPKLNCAPALGSNTLYVVIKHNSSSAGMLVGLNASDLKPKYKTTLNDPANGGAAYVDDDGTSAPTVGPDGDVYYGVLENPFGSHHYRGWLLHFNSTLATEKIPSSFGWDDAASIIPTYMVDSYTGTSDYLIMTKYNNYAGAGDGDNRIAVLDPNASQTDPYSGIQTMKEIITRTGPTKDTTVDPVTYPKAVREWCINSAAVDTGRKSVIVNNEDGKVYRWNLSTNKLSTGFRITEGIGQAYTPTLIGPNGYVYAISKATLFAIGNSDPR